MESAQKLQNAINFAKQNPNHPLATELRKRIETGGYDKEMVSLGYKTNTQKKEDAQIAKEGVKAEKFLDKTTAQQLVSPEVLKELPKAAYETVVGGALKFGKSALEAPVNIVQSLSGKEQTTLPVNDPITGKAIGSYQTDFQNKIVPQVEAGTKSPLMGTIEGVGAPVLGAIDASGIGATGKGAVSLAKQAGKTIAENVAKNAIETTAKNIAKGSAQSSENILKYITPEYSKKQIENSVSGIKKGLLFDKAIIEPSNRLKNSVDNVKDIIDINKPATENIVNLRNGIAQEAKAIAEKIGEKKMIYTFKDLQKQFDNIEIPISLKNEKTLMKTLKDVQRAAITKAKEQGGTVNGLFDARKEFDRLVDESFPNLFDSTGKPTNMNIAVRKVRDEMNNFITKNLPDGFGYGESMAKQSSMYDVIDNIKPKAVEEFKYGTNRAIREINKFTGDNPRTTKVLKAAGTLGGGIGIGGAVLGN